MKSSLLDRYLISHFASSFFALFGALFLIASVVAFVQLSSLTSVLKVSFGEMGLLYLYQLPQTLIYTLPITFFASIMVTLARLSGDSELIVLFSLKTSIWRVLRPFLSLAILLALALAIIGLFLQPKADYLRQALIFTKQDEVQINIKASEFGQKFGDWLLFVGKEIDKSSYQDIVLFSRDKKESSGNFVISNSAFVDNKSGVLTLELGSGKSYQTKEDSVVQIDFEKMQVNEQGNLKNLAYQGVGGYWQRSKTSNAVLKELIWGVIAPLFVILSIPATALGIYNPRFQKNRSGSIALFLTILYFVPSMTLCDKSLCLSYLVPPLWLIFTLIWAHKKLKTF